MRQENIITDEKLVLQAAQAIWAMNKYLVLACNQQDYQKVRTYLKANDRDLTAAYRILRNIETTYGQVPTEELPQLSNALYHMAGYFKKLVSSEERQKMSNSIQTNFSQALTLLEENTQKYQVHYLLHSNDLCDMNAERLTNPIYPEHDTAYLKECKNNLLEKGIRLSYE